MRATKRRWNVNVQKVHILLKGKPTRAYVCTKCLKAHKVQKVLSTPSRTQSGATA